MVSNCATVFGTPEAAAFRTFFATTHEPAEHRIASVSDTDRTSVGQHFQFRQGIRDEATYNGTSALFQSKNVFSLQFVENPDELTGRTEIAEPDRCYMQWLDYPRHQAHPHSDLGEN